MLCNYKISGRYNLRITTSLIFQVKRLNIITWQKHLEKKKITARQLKDGKAHSPSQHYLETKSFIFYFCS